MSPISTIQGIASGINFRDLVDQMVEVERAPARLLEARIQDIARRKSAWADFEQKVRALEESTAPLADGTGLRKHVVALSGPSGSSGQLAATAGAAVTAGSFSARVVGLATREKVGSAVFAERTEALGLEGEILVGGVAIQMEASESLDDLAAVLNRANRGSAPTGVAATVVAAPTGGYRLMLTAAATGSEGVQLADGADGLLRSLGFLDTTTTLKHPTSNGARSDLFSSAGAAVGTLRALAQPPAPGDVTIGGLTVSVDLSSDSLTAIAAAINDAAALAGSSVQAEVVEETATDGTSGARLEVSGTTSFVDAGGVLEILGVVEGGRAAVAQVVQGAALTAGDASTPAAATTLLTDLWAEGADAGVTVGDTLTLHGTRGDGGTFTTTFTVSAGATYQDLLDSLNSESDGFRAGSRTATASISATGRLVVTDDIGGESQVALSVVAANQGGGTLDFGTMEVAGAGRAREITAGADAIVEVDGGLYTRSSNVITDIVEGVTLRLGDVADEAVTVSIDWDHDATVAQVRGFVDAYNAVAAFANDQTAGAPLAGDSVVRSMRARLRDTLSATLGADVTRYGSLSQLGIRIDRNGLYTVDEATLMAAVTSDPESVASTFGPYASGRSGVLEYVRASDATHDGQHAVTVTQLAERAHTTGTGFGGVYLDDGTPDILRLTDQSTGSVYDFALTSGMTMAQIVDGLNTELGTATARRLQASAAFHSDGSGTLAVSTTPLAALRDDAGVSFGVASGDRFTISGTRADGSTFLRQWTVDDADTRTLADLEAEVGAALGTSVAVTLEDGALTVTSLATGRSPLAVSISSDNAGLGVFALGPLATSETGRGRSSITATVEGDQLAIQHGDFGSTPGFDVAFLAGDTDGTASLGLAAGAYRGVDVAGTIAGQAATGAGQLLTAQTGTVAEGLVVRHVGTGLGALGNVTYSRGLAGSLALAVGRLLESSTGGIQGTVGALDTQTQGLEERVARIDQRLDQRAADLNARFAKVEEALARAQQQAAWLQSQLGALNSND